MTHLSEKAFSAISNDFRFEEASLFHMIYLLAEIFMGLAWIKYQTRCQEKIPPEKSPLLRVSGRYG